MDQVGKDPTIGLKVLRIVGLDWIAGHDGPD